MIINPIIDYVYVALPGTQDELRQIFKICKHSSESLYRGFIPKEALVFSTDETCYFDMCNYFSIMHTIETDLEDRTYNKKFETFVKMCWLTDVYFSEGFKNPIGVHYNPRLNGNVIHPGGARQKVYSLFHTGPIDCLFFNTTGVEFEWMQFLNKIELDDYKDHFVALTADHGSIIPHVHFDQYMLHPNIMKYHKRILNRFNDNFSFESNFDIEPLHKWKTSLKPVVRIIFSEQPNFKDVVQSVILMSLGHSYKSERFEIQNL